MGEYLQSSDHRFTANRLGYCTTSAIQACSCYRSARVAYIRHALIRQARLLSPARGQHAGTRRRPCCITLKHIQPRPLKFIPLGPFHEGVITRRKSAIYARTPKTMIHVVERYNLVSWALLDQSALSVRRFWQVFFTALHTWRRKCFGEQLPLWK